MAWLAPLAAAFASSATSGGCTIKQDHGNTSTSTTTGSGGGDAGTGTGTGGSVANLTNRQLFETTVLPGLEANCVPCHVGGGFADFLAEPDPYASITLFKSGTDHKPLIWPIPDQSILYTYPDSVDHTGTKYLPKSADLKAKVLAWLTAEAKDLPPPPEAGPIDYLVAFKPILGGLNAIYLDQLGPKFVGSAISFTATELGTPPSLLQLSNVQVYPAGIALHLVHPLFQVYPGNSPVPQPDPTDQLADVDEVYTPVSPNRALGSGEVLIDNWQQDARLGLDFSLGKIETGNITADGGLVALCTNPDLFQQAVGTLMQGDAGSIICADCHGGAKPTAMAAMNLSGLLASPPDYGTACSYMRVRITPGDPASSQILDVTDPAHGAVIHMFKFNGNENAYKAFKTGISPWITAEQ